MPEFRRNGGGRRVRAEAVAPASCAPKDDAGTEKDVHGRPVDVGPLNNYLGYALRRAQMLAFADFIAALAELDLSPGQFGVLTVIDANPGLRQSEVSTALGIQKPNFVTLLNAFERRGLAVRRAAGDRRSYALYLTPAGRSLLRRARMAQARHEARLVERIGERGREQLLGLLGRLITEE